MKKPILGTLLLLAITMSGCTNQPKITPPPITPPSTQNQITYDGTILAIGDSLTEGYQLPIEDAYPAQLKNWLQSKGYNYDVINSGVSGETTTGLLERIDWILSQIEADIVILNTGANDAMRGIDLDITRENLRQIIQIIQAKNIPIILGGMEIYQNLGSDYTNEFKNLYPELAQEYQLALIPFFLDGVAADPSKNLSDQIHPNAEGYRIIVEQNIFPILEPWLNQTE